MNFKNFIIAVILLFQSVMENTKADNTNNETSKENVRFYLFTRNNPKSPQQLWTDDKQNLSNSNFNANSATKFILHGYCGTYKIPLYTPIRDSFLTRDNYNVILVDWSPIAKLDNRTAVSNVKYVGKKVAKMIEFLQSQGNDPNRMTLIGHSFGAHVAGSAGYQAKKKVPVLIALDPAVCPFCTGAGSELTKNDAQLVEVIHTCTATAGLQAPIGHVDFYPNGGENQLFCKEFTDGCSHHVAVDFYAEAIIQPDKWLGIKCSSYGKFKSGECNDSIIVPFPNAELVDKSHGVFMMRTADSSPYGLGVEGTRPPPAC